MRPKLAPLLTRARHGVAMALREAAPAALTLAALLLLWQLVAASPSAPVPSPLRVIEDSWDIIADPFRVGRGIDQGLFWHIAASLGRVAEGFLIAAAAGIGIGVILGQPPLMTRAFDPIFQLLRTVPPLAWLPLSLAIFRDGRPSAIFVIFITAVWPILINTAVGVRNIPPDYRNVARVLRLSPFEYFAKILMPACVPYVFTGLRIGAGLSWLAIVAAEMLIGGVGIGFFIWDAWNSSRLSDIIVALVYVGAVGLILDRAVAFVGRVVGRGVTA